MVPPEGEQLTTGWEPDLPPEDTLVRQAVLVHASWPVAVAGAAGRPWRSAARWAGGWIGDRGALTNPVILTQPISVPKTCSRRSTRCFRCRALPASQSVADSGSAGARPGPDRAPSADGAFPGPPTPLRRWPGEVREIRDPAELAVAERVLVEGYPMPELDPLTPGDLLGPTLLQTATRIWLAWLDGRGRDGRRSLGGGGHPCRVRRHPSRRARSGRGRGGDVGGHPRRPRPPGGTDRQRRRQTGLPRMGYLAVERWTAWLRPAR